MRNTVSFIPFIYYSLYKTLISFKASRYSSPQEERSSGSEQIATINTKTASFISPCEYSDVTLVVDWMLFVSSLEFTLPVFSNFSNNLIKNGKYISCASPWHAQHRQTSDRKSFYSDHWLFLYKTLHAFLQGFRFQIYANTPLSKRNFHSDHYKFQLCVYRMS